jgi:hypothetical protein
VAINFFDFFVIFIENLLSTLLIWCVFNKIEDFWVWPIHFKAFFCTFLYKLNDYCVFMFPLFGPYWIRKIPFLHFFSLFAIWTRDNWCPNLLIFFVSNNSASICFHNINLHIQTSTNCLRFWIRLPNWNRLGWVTIKYIWCVVESIVHSNFGRRYHYMYFVLTSLYGILSFFKPIEGVMDAYDIPCWDTIR